jgi:hypothetical protein
MMNPKRSVMTRNGTLAQNLVGWSSTEAYLS